MIPSMTAGYNLICLKPINHPTAASYVRTNILTDYNIEQAYAQTQD
jgi:hypothetical protein